MTITVHDTDADGAGGTTAASLSLPSTEGRQQLVALGGRTESTAPSISGTGWTLRALIETEIANTSARRQLAVWTRTVPAAASGTITANWAASTGKAAIGYEFSSDSGTDWNVTVGDDTDNDTSTTTGLESASLAPADAEALIVACFTARNSTVVTGGNLAYSDSFTAGPAGNSSNGAAANQCATIAAHFINSDLTARSTTAMWSPSPATFATSIILAISVDEGGGGGEVHADAQLAGSATVTATAHTAKHAAAQADGTATLTASAHIVKHADAQIAGTGVVDGAAHIARHADAQVDASATVDAAAHRARHADAQLDGIATLQGSAHVDPAGGAVHIDAQLSATATVEGAARVVKHTAAGITATATLTGSVHLARHATAELAAAATLDSTAHRRLHVDAQLTGTATLIAAATELTLGYVTLTTAAPTTTLTTAAPTTTLAAAAPSVTLAASKDTP